MTDYNNYQIKMTTSCEVIFINNYDAQYPMVMFHRLQSSKIVFTFAFRMLSLQGLKFIISLLYKERCQ